MATKIERGTKRTCQNDECGARFYDLMRDPITCPVCQSAFVPPPPPPPPRQSEGGWKTNNRAFVRPIVQPAPVVAAEVEEAELDAEVPAETEDGDTTIEPEKADLILELDEDEGVESSVVETPDIEDEM